MSTSDKPVETPHRASGDSYPYRAGDGKPFFLQVFAEADGALQSPSGLRFSTEVSAAEALRLLIGMGTVYSGYVCEDKRYLWRRKA